MNERDETELIATIVNGIHAAIDEISTQHQDMRVDQVMSALFYVAADIAMTRDIDRETFLKAVTEIADGVLK